MVLKVPPKLAPQKVELLIQSTQDLGEQKMSVLYWGKYKTGKTHCIASWPKLLVVAFDSNLSTLRKFPGIDIIRPKSAKDFRFHVVPEIMNRNLPYESIALDSWTSFYQALVAEGKASGLSGYDLWGDVLEKGLFCIKGMVETTSPRTPGDRCYNILGSVHESVHTDDKGAVIGIDPSLPGQSANLIAGFFDTVLVCQPESENVLEGTGQDRKAVRKHNYVCWSVPPDRFRSCGDGVGGGKYKTLPHKLDGTYPSLRRLWGMEGETDGQPDTAGA